MNYIDNLVAFLCYLCIVALQWMFVVVLFSHNTCLYACCLSVNAVEVVFVYMVLAHNCVCGFVVRNPVDEYMCVNEQ